MRALKFVKYLPEYGWKPTVLSAHPSIYDPNLLDSALEKEIAGTNIIRVWYPNKGMVRSGVATSVPVPGRENILTSTKQTVKNLVVPDLQIPWIFPAFQALRRLHRESHVDAIITTSPPNSAHLLGYLARQTLGIPWVMDYRDQWVGNPLYKTAAWRMRLESMLEGMCLRSADGVVAATPPIADNYREAEPRGPVIIITNGFDPEDFSAYPRAFPEVFTVSYVGSLSPTRSPEPFLLAWRSFINRLGLEPRQVRLNFTGPVYQLDLNSMVASDEILRQSVNLRSFVTHGEALQEMMNSSALLLLTSNAEGGATVLTGKVFEYIAANKPIICVAPPGALSELIEQRQLGASFESDRIEELSKYVETLFLRHCDGTLKSVTGRRRVEDFDRRILSGKLADLLDQVQNQG